MEATALRCVIDARPIEHPTAKQRGIGRYTAGLIGGLRDIGAHPLAMVATPDDVDLVAAQLPGVTVEVHHPNVFDRFGPETSPWYIATGLFLHPLSADPIPSYVTRSGVAVASVIYDVIPYRFPDRYQVAESARRQAQLRAPLARTCDAFLAISDFSARTAIEELRLDGSRMSVIGAGVDDRFSAVPPLPNVDIDRLLRGHRGGFVVAVTGKDPHKNNQRLFQAWGRVQLGLRNDRRLVVVGAIDTATRVQWTDWTRAAGCEDSVVFTGPVTDTELVGLLQRAELSVMASLEEGFGLPVAEAAACGCPTICSNVSSLPEVLDEPLAGFDPLDPVDIARCIELSLVDRTQRVALSKAAERSAVRWRWPAVAQRVVDSLCGSRAGSGPSRRATRPRLTILVDDSSAAAAAIGELIACCGSMGVEFVPAPTEQIALGSLLPVHDLDEILALVNPLEPQGSTYRCASRFSTHVWLTSPLSAATSDEDLRLLTRWARSAIVADGQDVAAVKACSGRDLPVLVVDPRLAVKDLAGQILEWVTDGCRGA